MSQETLVFCGNDERYLKKELTLNSNSMNSGSAFRIPSIIKSGNTLVAVVDKMSSGDGWGFIELAVRRSENGGNTWSPVETIAAPPARLTTGNRSSYASAFFVNPCMALAPNGDIVLLVDFYPENKSPENEKLIDKKKIPYSSYNGRMRPVLYDRDDNMYIVTEDNRVLNGRREMTDYRIGDWKGSLYKGDEYVGNIYLNGRSGSGDANSVTTFGAPLKAPKRSYVFMLRSSDNGKTWTKPRDITMEILKPDDGPIIGVSSGVGYTTKQGRIIMPLYADGKQSIAIFSVDDGESWHRMTQQPYAATEGEWQITGTDDGILIGISNQERSSKASLSVSTNDGKNWERLGKTDLESPKCQMGLLALKNFVFCSHPAGKDREKGVISIGRFTKAKGSVSGIAWLKDIEINNSFFGFSSLCIVDDEHIGVLYEAQPSSYICFKKYIVSGFI